jgi:benzoate/toluate 1,2-dioxygenase beta subunit
VTIEEADGTGCIVRSKWQLLEYRRETQRIFGGTSFHRLVRGDNGIQIAWKRVDLVNCDAPLEGLVVPF